jgi:hypothetical protein
MPVNVTVKKVSYLIYGRLRASSEAAVLKGRLRERSPRLRGYGT